MCGQSEHYHSGIPTEPHTEILAHIPPNGRVYSDTAHWRTFINIPQTTHTHTPYLTEGNFLFLVLTTCVYKLDFPGCFNPLLTFIKTKLRWADTVPWLGGCVLPGM